MFFVWLFKHFFSNEWGHRLFSIINFVLIAPIWSYQRGNNDKWAFVKAHMLCGCENCVKSHSVHFIKSTFLKCDIGEKSSVWEFNQTIPCSNELFSTFPWAAHNQTTPENVQKFWSPKLFISRFSQF